MLASRIQPVRAPQDPQTAADLAELRGGPAPEREAELRRRIRERAWQRKGSGEVRRPGGLAELPAGLGDDTALVAYVVTAERVVALVVTSAGTAGTTSASAPGSTRAGRAARRPGHGGRRAARRGWPSRCATRWPSGWPRWRRCSWSRCSTAVGDRGRRPDAVRGAGRCPVDAAARAWPDARSPSPRARRRGWPGGDAAAGRLGRVRRRTAGGAGRGRGPGGRRGVGRRTRAGRGRGDGRGGVRPGRAGRRPARGRARSARGRQPALLRAGAGRRHLVRLRRGPAARRTRRRAALGLRGRAVLGALGRGADRDDRRVAARGRPLRGGQPGRGQRRGRARRAGPRARRAGCRSRARRGAGRGGGGGLASAAPAPFACFG